MKARKDLACWGKKKKIRQVPAGQQEYLFHPAVGKKKQKTAKTD